MIVIHITDGLGTGGQERQLVELLKGVNRSPGVRTVVVVLSREVHFEEIDRLPQVEVVHLPRRWRKDPTVALRLASLCRRRRADLLVAWGPMSAVYGAFVAATQRIKLVNFMIQNAPDHIPPLSSLWIRRAVTFPLSSVVVANSRAGLAAYQTRRPSAVIYNGFDPDRVRHLTPPEAVRARFGLRRPYVVGMVASFSSKKDQLTLVQAAARLFGERNDVEILFVGDGPCLAGCRAWASRVAPGRIHFLGRQRDVESIVNLFSIGVLTTYTEGLSNAIMEYMALAKPVIATDGGGTCELVVDGETGYLVAQGDVEGVARRLIQLLDQPDLATRMGEAGRARLFSEFSFDRMVEAHLDLYRRLLS